MAEVGSRSPHLHLTQRTRDASNHPQAGGKRPVRFEHQADRADLRLPDGAPYFEAVALLAELRVELSENRLALCPTCAAKWRHARRTGEDEVAESSSDAVDVVLAGETASVRFVEVHLGDVRVALAALRPAGQERSEPRNF